jgi:hypothetical protein
VADALEADRNDKLRVLAEAEEQYKRQREKDRKVVVMDACGRQRC